MLTPLLVLLRSIGLICRGHRAVALENLALRQQLAALTRTTRRPQLRTRDRLFWILLAKAWQAWRTAIMIVQPDTVVRWHRQWLRRQSTWRSTRTRTGRPTTDATVRALVGKMAAANPLWGAPRIHGEWCKLGIVVSERTVSRLLRRPRLPPSQTWRTFLTNHVATLVCFRPSDHGRTWIFAPFSRPRVIVPAGDPELAVRVRSVGTLGTIVAMRPESASYAVALARLAYPCSPLAGTTGCRSCTCVNSHPRSAISRIRSADLVPLWPRCPSIDGRKLLEC